MILTAIAAAAALNTAAEAQAVDIGSELPIENISENSDRWFANLSRRDPSCGRLGSVGKKLARRYDEITNSVAIEDGAAVIEAAANFSAYLNDSGLAEDCWDVVRKRAGISRKVDRKIEEIADLI
ncbi:MAG: hypothetical protein AAFV51_13850 [Pseudomonadota bacterium]